MKPPAKILSLRMDYNQSHFVERDFLEKWKLAISLNILIEIKFPFMRVMIGNKTCLPSFPIYL